MNGKKYVVSYEIDYVHRVSVGVTAVTAEAARTEAESAFDAGRIWDDTDGMPLLYDEYEEVTNGALGWMPVEEVDEFPRRSFSVIQDRAQRQALTACRALIEAYRTGKEAGGSVDWEDLDHAHALAVAAIRWYDHPNRDVGGAESDDAAEEAPRSPRETEETIGEPEAMEAGSRFEHMYVAGLNPNGEADVLPLSVEVTEEQWALGEHLSAAEALAAKAGWEGPFVVFSSDETANLRRASIHGTGKPRLAILVKGGFVEGIVTDGVAEHPFLSEIDVAIVDYDVEGSDPEEYVVEVPQASGNPKKARVSFEPVLDARVSLDSVFDRRIGG